jgi:hypothetical protein
MSKNTKGIVTVVAVVVFAVAIYHFTHATKKVYAQRIIKLGGSSNYITLLTFDEGYLKEWSKALTNARETFDYNGKTYRTSGGTTV